MKKDDKTGIQDTETTEDLKTDLVKFAEDFCGINLTPYQKDFIKALEEMNSSDRVLKWDRVGATTTMWKTQLCQQQFLKDSLHNTPPAEMKEEDKVIEDSEIEEMAFNASVDYKPFETDLPPQKYYERGFIDGAKRAMAIILETKSVNEGLGLIRYNEYMKQAKESLKNSSQKLFSLENVDPPKAWESPPCKHFHQKDQKDDIVEFAEGVLGMKLSWQQKKMIEDIKKMSKRKACFFVSWSRNQFKNTAFKIANPTNDDFPFRPGEIIEYAGDRFTVIENRGDRGKVQEYPDGDIVDPFYWTFEGSVSRRVLMGVAGHGPGQAQAYNQTEEGLIGEMMENGEWP